MNWLYRVINICGNIHSSLINRIKTSTDLRRMFFENQLVKTVIAQNKTLQRRSMPYRIKQECLFPFLSRRAAHSACWYQISRWFAELKLYMSSTSALSLLSEAKWTLITGSSLKRLSTIAIKFVRQSFRLCSFQYIVQILYGTPWVCTWVRGDLFYF